MKYVFLYCLGHKAYLRINQNYIIWAQSFVPKLKELGLYRGNETTDEDEYKKWKEEHNETSR